MEQRPLLAFLQGRRRVIHTTGGWRTCAANGLATGPAHVCAISCTASWQYATKGPPRKSLRDSIAWIGSLGRGRTSSPCSFRPDFANELHVGLDQYWHVNIVNYGWPLSVRRSLGYTSRAQEMSQVVVLLHKRQSNIKLSQTISCKSEKAGA